VDGHVYQTGDALSGGAGSVIAIITDPTASTYVDQNLPGGFTYYYTLFAYDDLDLSYTNVGDGVGKEPVSVSQVVNTVITAYVDLTTVNQTIDTGSAPTAVVGINVMDQNRGALVSAVTIRLAANLGTDPTDLAPILASNAASGVAIYQDNGAGSNGVFDPLNDALVPLAYAQARGP
jgi:hypothetical protein